MEKSKITKAALGRMPQYLEYIENIHRQNIPFVSATKVARDLAMGEVQVRKDLNAVCGKGKPKLGYHTVDLLTSIESCLGQKSNTPAVLVGAGRLGKALLEYDEFEKYGVQIVAAFDCSEQILKAYNSTKVLPMSQFRSFCQTHGVRIGIITVGEGSAQTVCDQMLESGITAIWNFAPCKLNVPDGTLFLQENLALSLAYLNSQLLDHKSKENKNS